MKLYRVKGNSMYPLLRDNDLVCVRKTSTKSLRRGNIVVYLRKEGEYIVHRLIKKERDSVLWLRGDGHNLIIESATTENITGKVVGFFRYRRYNAISRTRELHSWFIALAKEAVKNHVGFIFGIKTDGRSKCCINR